MITALKMSTGPEWTGEGGNESGGSSLLPHVCCLGWGRRVCSLSRRAVDGERHKADLLFSFLFHGAKPSDMHWFQLCCGVLFKMLVLLMAQISEEQGEEDNIY